MLKLVIFLLALSLYTVSLMTDAYAVDLFARPDGLGSGNNWGSGTFADIDESIRDDSDYVTSDSVKQNQNSKVDFSLSNEKPISADATHTIRYTIKENGLSASNNPNLVVTLKEAGTSLTTWTESSPLPTTFTLQSHEIPKSVFAQIQNYADLTLEFKADCSTDVCNNTTPGETVSVSWVELEYHWVSSSDYPPPEILGIEIYKMSDLKNQPSYSGTAKTPHKTEPQPSAYFSIGHTIPTQEISVNEPMRIAVKLDGMEASTKIEHVSLISTNTKASLNLENFEISTEKGKAPNIIDPNKILKNVSSEYYLENGNLWVYFDLTFQKPLKKSNIILQAWDHRRTPVHAQVFDVLDIIDPYKTPIVVETHDRLKMTITQKILSHDCYEDNSCYIPVISINKGGSVVWINEDSIMHIMASVPKKGDPDKFRFTLTPQKSFEKVFPRTGTYQYYCVLHPWTIGTIIVHDAGKEATGYYDAGNNIKTHQYSDFKVVSVSTGNTITNGQTIILKDHNVKVQISGNLPGGKNDNHVEINIKKPDGQIERLFPRSMSDGSYFAPIVLSKKWQAGNYEIIEKCHEEKTGHIKFTITDKSSEKPEGKPAEKPEGKPAEKPEGKPAEKPEGKHKSK